MALEKLVDFMWKRLRNIIHRILNLEGRLHLKGKL